MKFRGKHLPLIHNLRVVSRLNLPYPINVKGRIEGGNLIIELYPGEQRTPLGIILPDVGKVLDIEKVGQ